MGDSNLIEGMLKNKELVIGILYLIDFFSFLLSFSLFILFFNTIIMHFSSFLAQIIFYIIIFLVTLLLFKNNYFSIFSKISFKGTFKSLVKINDLNIKSIFSKFIDFLYLSKIIIFNTLKNLFGLIIVGLFISGFYYYFGYFNNLSFVKEFIGIIGLISIILGMFQFYLNNYKQTVYNNLISYITNFFQDFQSKFTYEEFIKWYGKEKFEKDYNKNIIETTKSNLLLKSIKLGRKEININTINSDNIDEFKLIEIIAKEKKKYSNLKIKYENFFLNREELIKKTFKELPKTELKGMLYDNIVFFEEMLIITLKSKTNEDVSKSLTFNTYGDYHKKSLDNLMKEFVLEIIK